MNIEGSKKIIALAFILGASMISCSGSQTPDVAGEEGGSIADQTSTTNQIPTEETVGRKNICLITVQVPSTPSVQQTDHFDVKRIRYNVNQNYLFAEVDPDQNDSSGVYTDNYFLALELTFDSAIKSAVVAQRAIRAMGDPSDPDIFYYLFVDANGGFQIATGNLSNFTFE